MDNKIDMLATIAVCVLFFAAVMATFHFLGDYVYTYRDAARGVEILLFRSIPIAVFSYENLESVDVATTRQLLKSKDPSVSFHLNIVNRLRGPVVLLRRRRGLFRVIAISPRHANEFAIRVKQHLKFGNEATQ